MLESTQCSETLNCFPQYPKQVTVHSPSLIISVRIYGYRSIFSLHYGPDFTFFFFFLARGRGGGAEMSSYKTMEKLNLYLIVFWNQNAYS